MKYWIVLIAFIGISNLSSAEQKLILASYYLDSSVFDSTISSDQAAFTFSFYGFLEKLNRREIHYSIDGSEDKFVLKKGVHQLEIVTTPGNHIFQFYTTDYFEIYMDSIQVLPQYNSFYTLEFSQGYELSEKPVIYLYPQRSTSIEFKINVKGNNAFYYPPTDSIWNFTAAPNGDLTFGSDVYNYLFWEATIPSFFNSVELKSGFIVEGDNVVQFLENKLTEAGLTSKEQADFITYWAPRMSTNEYNLIHFLFNEACDKYASFEINPKPDNIYRIYMKWSRTTGLRNIEPQTMRKINREGFTVIEWGGQQTRFRRINYITHEKITL